jgi:hypothetical protein
MKNWRSGIVVGAALLLALACGVPQAEARHGGHGGFHGGGFHGGHDFHGGGFRGGYAFHSGHGFRGGHGWHGGYGHRWHGYIPYRPYIGGGWSAAPSYYYAPYYGGGCGWLYRKAVRTGSAYWWNRYSACVD